MPDHAFTAGDSLGIPPLTLKAGQAKAGMVTEIVKAAKKAAANAKTKTAARKKTPAKKSKKAVIGKAAKTAKKTKIASRSRSAQKPVKTVEAEILLRLTSRNNSCYWWFFS